MANEISVDRGLAAVQGSLQKNKGTHHPYLSLGLSMLKAVPGNDETVILPHFKRTLEVGSDNCKPNFLVLVDKST